MPDCCQQGGKCVETAVGSNGGALGLSVATFEAAGGDFKTDVGSVGATTTGGFACPGNFTVVFTVAAGLASLSSEDEGLEEQNDASGGASGQCLEAVEQGFAKPV